MGRRKRRSRNYQPDAEREGVGNKMEGNGEDSAGPDGSKYEEKRPRREKIRSSVTMAADCNGNGNKNDDDDGKDQQKLLCVSYPAQSLLVGLDLEAIFHPKFENEAVTDRTVRARMLEDMCRNQTNGAGLSEDLSKGGSHGRIRRRRCCYLEASLKHSGSLLLWSGGRHPSTGRFYSKNSTDNVYTAVGEYLLRRFIFLDDDEGYRRCAEVVSSGNLTCAFECVAWAVGDLIGGDHGDVPLRDYMVLTAVADRSLSVSGKDDDGDDDDKQPRFYSTREVVAFAQRYGLPHNDIFVFQESESCRALFRLYDSMRETGTAGTVIPAMEKIADRHLCGPCPHQSYQGEILEGLVVRRVWEDEEGNDEESELPSWESLAQSSREILKVKEAKEGKTTSSPYVSLRTLARGCDTNEALCRKIRRILDDCNENKDCGSDQATNQISSDGRRCRRRMIRRTKESPKECEAFLFQAVDAWWERMTHVQSPSNADGRTSETARFRRTRRVARLLRRVRDLKIPVSFKLLREDEWEEEEQVGQQPQSLKDMGSSSSMMSRWLCILHVLRDAAFSKYYSHMNEEDSMGDDMMLYRGFCLRLILEGDVDASLYADTSREGREANICNESSMATVIPMAISPPQLSLSGTWSTSKKTHRQIRDPPLMLKMKLLPYMVRTFLCRNGLSLMEESSSMLAIGGTQAMFERHAASLLQKWDVSAKAVDKWTPFLSAWAAYARPRLMGHVVDNGDGPLTKLSYLPHLHSFRRLYEREEWDAIGWYPPSSLAKSLANDDGGEESHKPFRGWVVVVGLPDRPTTTSASPLVTAYANRLSSALGCRFAVSHDFREVTDGASLALSLRPGGGRVCCVTVTDGNNRIPAPAQAVVRRHADAIHVVLYRCSSDDIARTVATDNNNDGAAGGAQKHTKKLEGIVRSWRNRVKNDDRNQRTCVRVSETDGTDVTDAAVLASIRETSEALPEPDLRKGVLVFFPAIPGSGKSCLCQGLLPSSLPWWCSLSSKADDQTPSQSLIETETSIETSVTPSSSPHQERPRPRTMSLRVGDETKKKYWPTVRTESSELSSSLYVTDKNAPPVVWDTVLGIAAARHGPAVAILPSGGAMHTERVGDDKDDVYPFSLAYLAVCMRRVLDRSAKTHAGGLEGSTVDDACMVVAKFFFLYRGITANDLVSSSSSSNGCGIGEVLEGAAVRAGAEVRVLQVPFFREIKDPNENEDNIDPQSLPSDLEGALRDALKLHARIEQKVPSRGKPWKLQKKAWSAYCQRNNDDNGDGVASVETRLRASLDRHGVWLRSLAVAPDESIRSLRDQLSSLVQILDNGNDDNDNGKLPTTCTTDETSPSSDPSSVNQTIQTKDVIAIHENHQRDIRLVSLDVNFAEVRQFLSNLMASHPEVRSYFNERGGLPGLPTLPVVETAPTTIKTTTTTTAKEDTLTETNATTKKDSFVHGRFVDRTHITLMHPSQAGTGLSRVAAQARIRDDYEARLGWNVEAYVTGLWYDEGVAALAVDLRATNTDTPTVVCHNAFPHLTVWHATDVPAMEANNLPRSETARYLKLQPHDPQQTNDHTNADGHENKHGSAKGMVSSAMVLTGTLCFWWDD